MLEIVSNWHPLWVHFAIALLLERDARVVAIPERQEQAAAMPQESGAA